MNLASSLPTVAHPRVAHVGSMRAEDKGRGPCGRESYEDHGLSVSLDPDAWQDIAGVGGSTWALSHTTGLLLDAHELAPEQRAEVVTWGEGRGLVTLVNAWRVSYHDCELDEEVYQTLPDEATARLEAELLEATFDPTPVSIAEPTDALRAILGMRSHPDCLDHLLVVYVEQETDLQGVWWEDERGPCSAPRGVILPGRVPEWRAEQVTYFDLWDEDEGDWDEDEEPAAVATSA